MKIKLLAYMALALASATASHATIIYESGAPNGGSGVASDVGGNILVADDFSLSSGATTFNQVTWWGIYSPTGSSGGTNIVDNFTIAIYESANGVPFTNPLETYSLGAVSRVEVGPFRDNFYYEYFANISSTSLQANTTYYLSIWNNTSGAVEDWFWMGAVGATGANATYHRTRVSNAWSPRGSAPVAYNLSNEVAPVPEPATMSLLGIGLVGLALRYRKRVA